MSTYGKVFFYLFLSGLFLSNRFRSSGATNRIDTNRSSLREFVQRVEGNTPVDNACALRAFQYRQISASNCCVAEFKSRLKALTIDFESFG